MSRFVGGTALGHADFHTALGHAGELDVVHEAANQEYTAAARLQQVLRRQRIGDQRGIEALTLIADPDGQLECPVGVLR